MRATRAAALALVGALAGAACTGPDGTAPAPRNPELQQIDTGPTGLFPADEREPAPAISGTALDGATRIDVADYRGKVVVLNFWAHWCAPCRAESPNLNAVARETADDGVQFLGVNVKDDLQPARRFEQVQGTPYPSIHDQASRVLLRFRKLVPQTPPTTLLIDKQGRIAGRLVGGVTRAQLLEPVLALAAEPA